MNELFADESLWVGVDRNKAVKLMVKALRCLRRSSWARGEMDVDATTQVFPFKFVEITESQTPRKSALRLSRPSEKPSVKKRK